MQKMRMAMIKKKHVHKRRNEFKLTKSSVSQYDVSNNMMIVERKR